MPITSVRIWPALAGALLLLLAAAALTAPAALAGAPATVTVRVLGAAPNYEALTPLTQVTTTTAPVGNDGNPMHTCAGTSGAGALQLATAGNWSGEWYEGMNNGYLVEKIDGMGFPPYVVGAPTNYYWSFWFNNEFSEHGICEIGLEQGEQMLFFPTCEGTACPPAPLYLLGIEVPATAEVGRPLSVTVVRYNAKGEPSHVGAGINVGGWGASTTTNAEGKATVVFPGDQTYTLRATGAAGEEPLSVPGEALVCAHTGNDGACGTTAPPGTTPVSGSTASSGVAAASPSYTGPYAVVADVAGIREGHVYPKGKGPRTLAGTVSAHASVTSISLRLRRTYRGHCWAYNGSREGFQRVRCGQGSFFQIASGGDSFSYLLPSRLLPGRYVLDIAAADSAGSHAPLDRGSSRIVFYVK